MDDLRTKTGCVSFVRHQVLPQVEAAFKLHNRCQKFGIAFATMHQSVRLDAPKPVPVSLGPLGGRDARRMMTQVIDKTHSIGGVFVRQDDFPMRNKAYPEQSLVVSAIVVQLEHKSFPDLTWTAYIQSVSRSLDPWIGPVGVGETPVQVGDLRFLANRWMS